MEGGLPHILVETKGIPSCCSSLLQDAEVSAVNRHHDAVVAYVVGAKPTCEDNLGGGDSKGEEMTVDVSADKKYYSPRCPPAWQCTQ